MQTISRDRLRRLVDLLLASLDEPNAAPLPAQAYLSRFHLDRLISAGLREPPVAFRRRLVLERAGWRLQRGMSVTEAGLEAGYEATESFIRAFRRTHGTSPGRFAAAGVDFRVPAGNGVHFHPPAGLLLPVPGGRDMSLTDRMLEHDRWLVDQLIGCAERLPESDLDRAVRPGHEVLSFDGPEATVRQMLDRLVWTKEVWSAAIAGRELPGEPDRSMAALRERSAAAGAEFLALARRNETQGTWDTVFVDALCEPPQSFTFGSVVAHVLTYSAYRCQVLTRVLDELGVTDLPVVDPIEWERARLSEKPLSGDRLRGGVA